MHISPAGPPSARRPRTPRRSPADRAPLLRDGRTPARRTLHALTTLALATALVATALTSAPTAERTEGRVALAAAPAGTTSGTAGQLEAQGTTRVDGHLGAPRDGGVAPDDPADHGVASDEPADHGPASEEPAEHGVASDEPADHGPASEEPADDGLALDEPADHGVAPDEPADASHLLRTLTPAPAALAPASAPSAVPEGAEPTSVTAPASPATATTTTTATPAAGATTSASVTAPPRVAELVHRTLRPVGGPDASLVSLLGSTRVSPRTADLRRAIGSTSSVELPTSTATPTPSPTPTPTPSPSPSVTATPTPTPSPTPTLSSPSATPAPSPSPSPSPTATPTPTPTPTLTPPASVPPVLTASQQLTPEQGLLFGAFAGTRDAPDTETAMRDLESLIGRKLDLHRWYSIWDDPMPPTSVRQSVERGRTPVLSILPKLRNGTKLPWAEVASGVHDARIREQAAGVRSLEVPLYLVFHHEPDYSPEYGTPAEYRAAYRHYVEVFRTEGVTNVAWTWVMTPAAFNDPPTTPTKVGADDLYPGDDVVDWVALDPYNWNGCAANVPQRWRTMAEIATPFRTWGVAHGKPLMLAEWNSFEDALDPERKASWYRETMSTLASWPEVKAVAVFNTTGTCDWWITSSASAVAGFVDAGARASAHGRASAWLVPSTLTGPSPLEVTFDASRSTGSDHTNGTGVTRWTLDFGDGTSTSGDGQPPAAITHTYAGGSFEAVLTVTDAAGTTNVDRRTVTSAAAPKASTAVRNITTTSLELHAWIETGGIVGHAQMEWGPTTAYGSASPVMDLAAVVTKTPVAVTVTNLQPGTTYYWRLTVTTEVGTTVLDLTTFTAGPPTTTWAGATLVTTGSAEPYAGVHPHRAATTAYLEWGATQAFGQVTATQELTALTYEKTLRYPLTGLARGTTYWFRVVATNEHGTLVGPTKSFRTAP